MKNVNVFLFIAILFGVLATLIAVFDEFGNSANFENLSRYSNFSLIISCLFSAIYGFKKNKKRD